MSCAGECSVKNFGLNHPNPEIFVNSQWKVPQIVYFVYRIVVAIFFLVWLILSGIINYGWSTTESNRVKWFIYLTNWMFTTLTIDTIIQAIVVGVSFPKLQKGDVYKDMAWYIKAMWVIYNISCTISVVVSLAFWILLYPAMGNCPSNEVLTSCGSPATPTCADPSPVAAEICGNRCQCPSDLPIWNEGTCIKLADCPSPNSSQWFNATYVKEHVYTLHYVDIITHGVNAAYVLLNFFITGIPIRIQHFWHAIIFAVIYSIFSIIYDVSNGTNALDKPYIYSPLDWTANPGSSTIYAVGVGIIAPILVWLIFYGLYWIRISIAKCCNCGNKYAVFHKNGSQDVMLTEQGKSNFGSINSAY